MSDPQEYWEQTYIAVNGKPTAKVFIDEGELKIWYRNIPSHCVSTQDANDYLFRHNPELYNQITEEIANKSTLSNLKE